MPENIESYVRQQQKMGYDGGAKFQLTINVGPAVSEMVKQGFVSPSGRKKWKLTNKGRREFPANRAKPEMQSTKTETDDVKYELGDIIEADVKQCRTHEFVIVATEDRPRCNPFLVASLNGKSEGKSAYSIKHEQIRKVIRKEPDHPWIWSVGDKKHVVNRSGVYTVPPQLKNLFTVDEIKEALGVSQIIVEMREGDWYAEVEHHPEWFSLGDTAPDAIGKLVVLHGSNFGLTIKAKE